MGGGGLSGLLKDLVTGGGIRGGMEDGDSGLRWLEPGTGMLGGGPSECMLGGGPGGGPSGFLTGFGRSGR